MVMLMNLQTVKSTIKKLLPTPAVEAIKNTLHEQQLRKLSRVKKNPYQPGAYPDGVNLTGFIRAEMGLGESCRRLAAALKHAQIPFSAIDYQHGACARMEDDSWGSFMHGAQYAVNVTVINADELPYAIPALEKEKYWDRHYQIAHYAWELPEYPAEWAKISEIFDEIWTPSTFCTDAIAAAVKCPVRTIPYIIAPEISQKRSREYFGLPEDRFLFLCMFDVNSVIQRKNPKAAIDAFRKAFGGDASNVGLVIKVNDVQGTPEAQEYLQGLIRECSNIYLLNKVLSRNDVNALIQVCDSFVSMHRSEGFGLVMAESMYLGKPVIATNWSSNTDFMNHENSCPVSYRLVEVDQDYAVYKKGQIWADPDVDDCARYMRRLVEEPAYCAAIAEAGRKTILEKYSADSSAQAIRQRLDQILKEQKA